MNVRRYKRMLKINFNVFWDHVEKQNHLKNEDWRKLHYIEKKDKFILLIKSKDFWKYFTEVPIKKILEFGSYYDVTREQAIEDFKINFLNDAMPVESNNSVVKEISMELKKELGPIEEEESKGYADFLEKEFSKWEKKILSFLDETLSDEVFEKGYNVIEKTFGDFMRRLFNVVNTSNFRTKIEASIRRIFKEGIEEAELETNVDVGFDEEFQNDVKAEAGRQLDGFFIGGKPWAGIKGVSQELQRDIREKVVEGITRKESLSTIRNNVKDVMVKYKGGTRLDGTITKGRTMRIARTESNRYRQSAKIKAYEKSGVVRGKKWNTFFDNRTDDICKRLHHQEVGLNELFIDPATGLKYDQPPSPHPNCRCSLTAVLLE
jgi:hypothetical protein